MQTEKSGWGMQRAAAWLRRRAWGAAGAQCARAPEEPMAAVQAEAVPDDEPEEIDIAGWPALVAPFYD